MRTEILIYNNYTNKMERFLIQEGQPMPYTSCGCLTVRDFRADSDSSVLWTDIRTLKAWENFCKDCGAQFKPDKAFRRIWEGGCQLQSQHFAGMELDAGAGLSASQQEMLYRKGKSGKRWSRVRRAQGNGQPLHLDKRIASGNESSAFPILGKGMAGTYVLVLQDALAATGLRGAGLSGCFDEDVEHTLLEYQRSRGLPSDGRATALTWSLLAPEACGCGHTNTVLKP